MEKKNVLLNPRNHEPDTDKMFLYAKDPYKAKCQLLINKRESKVLKYLNDLKAFIEYSNGMDDIYKNIEEYNLYKKQKVFIVFGDMISDMLIHKKLNTVITEWFIRGRKLSIFLDFIAHSYFAVPKNIGLNSTNRFAMKFQNKRELQQIEFNYSSGIDFQEFMSLDKKCIAKPHSLLVTLVTDTTLASDNSSRFRKNVLERTQKLIMIIDDKIIDEKIQYDIRREAVKISAVSSGKIDKHEYLTGEEILPSYQSIILEQAKFTYSPLGKAFEKQIIEEDQGTKQVEAL